jgi:multidrug efflux system membrane fusion protein
LIGLAAAAIVAVIVYQAVTPLTTVTVNTQINGQLMSVGFKEGQLVHKGQFLAQIDPRPYQVALEQDEAQLARDDATLKQAQMDLTRYQTLSQQASIPRQTYEDQVWNRLVASVTLIEALGGGWDTSQLQR